MAKLLALYLNISLLIPLIAAQCNIEKAEPYLRRSVYEFSVNLVSRLSEDTDNHFVTSALSPWTLLSTVSLGATEETLNEIKRVLRLHPHKCFNRKFFEIIKKITASSDGLTLERSSTLFIDNRMPVKEIFTNRIKKTEVCDIETIPFENFENAAATINDYVNRATRGTVDSVVDPNDLQGVYLVLVDALYFKGTWKYKFSEEETETSVFYDEKENPIGDVSLMYSLMNVPMASIDIIKAKALELPYTNAKYSMLLLLPNKDITIAELIDNLRRVSLSTILSQLPEESDEVSVQIPRFKITSDLENMKELLIDMGLNTLFDPDEAKLADISDYSLFISKFIQKAFVEVTEEGTEASAATTAVFESRSLSIPNDFTANKPFLFMIVDKETEIAVFTGAYSKPSIY